MRRSIVPCRVTRLLSVVLLYAARASGADLAFPVSPLEPASDPGSLEWVHPLPTAWPLLGAISSPFGWRRSPFGGAPEWHPGIDITAAYGTPVRATADGRVAFAGRRHGYGVLVVVDHGLASTRYAHLSAVWVRPGQAVLRGEALGALGGTGRATGPHLHYEVRVGGQPFDPECVLADGALPASATRPLHACAQARGRHDRRHSSPTARDAAHATPRAGAAG